MIAIDALSARACGRIGTAIQITDTGILPGSGVGNHRAGLTRDTLGVPVVAIGVPTVVYSAVIVRDALAALRAEHPEELARQLTDQDMVVTPREIDQMVSELGQVLSMGINLALQPRMDANEIATLMNEIL